MSKKIVLFIKDVRSALGAKRFARKALLMHTNKPLASYRRYGGGYCDKRGAGDSRLLNRLLNKLFD